jgi:hypothetical protein
MTILLDHLGTLVGLWKVALLAGLVIGAGVTAGWWLARDTQSAFVRLVRAWLSLVVRPLFGRSRWLRRTIIIAANNSLVCLIMVLMGALGQLAWLGVAGTGLGLGAALRLMLTKGPAVGLGPPPTHRRPVLEGVGFAVNMLEIPAILMSASLSLGQSALGSLVATGQALHAFLLVVVPLLLLAAMGEALWMSVTPLPPGWGLGPERPGPDE